ncbi:unnamed protein product, partial [Amoebophrya sp. A120]|eukprot:GSA120T00017285001.1
MISQERRCATFVPPSRLARVAFSRETPAVPPVSCLPSGLQSCAWPHFSPGQAPFIVERRREYNSSSSLHVIAAEAAVVRSRW